MAAVTRPCVWCGQIIKSYDYGKRHRIRCSDCVGLSRRFSVERKAFDGARFRCLNPSAPQYADYGGRGIEFRFQHFYEFLHALGPKPDGRYYLDRKDNDGHYEPSNVRWASMKESQCNKRNVRLIEIDGMQDSLRGHCKRFGTSLGTVHSRIKAGASLEAALKYRESLKRGPGAVADWGSINQSYSAG